MNREIRFRGISIESGEWVYGGWYSIGDEKYIVEDHGNYHESFEVFPSSLCEGTFVCEIFEGSTVVFESHHYNQKSPRNGYEGVVKMQDGSWVVDSGKISYPLFQEGGLWWTTGNIHTK